MRVFLYYFREKKSLNKTQCHIHGKIVEKSINFIEKLKIKETLIE